MGGGSLGAAGLGAPGAEPGCVASGGVVPAGTPSGVVGCATVGVSSPVDGLEVGVSVVGAEVVAGG